MFRRVCALMVATVVLVSGFQTASGADKLITVSPYSYAAIAYNPVTGKHAYAYNYRSRAGAEQEALRRCPGEDSRIVCWVNRGFCTLALGEDESCYGIGYTYNDGAYLPDAKAMAIEDCKQRTTNVRIVVALSSDGQYQYDDKLVSIPQ